jgi:hypothetical protein
MIQSSLLRLLLEMEVAAVLVPLAGSVIMLFIASLHSALGICW